MNLAKVQNLKGNSFCKEGKYDSAIDCYNQAILFDPHNSLAYYNRGYAFYLQGMHSDAIHSYRMAIDINPQCHLALFNMAQCLYERGEYHSALDYYHQAFTVDAEKYVAISSNYGLTLMELGKYQEAILYFDKKLNKLNNTDGLSSKAYCLFMLGNHQQALICCEKVLKIDKDDSLTHNYKGQINLSLQLFASSLESFDLCLKLDPNSSSANYYKSIALHHLNKYSESCKSYSKALQQNPNLENELINRGLVNFNILQATTLITNGHYTIGLSLILQVMTMNPTNTQASAGQKQCIVLIEKRLNEITQDNCVLKQQLNREQLSINNRVKLSTNQNEVQQTMEQQQLIQQQLNEKEVQVSELSRKMNRILSRNSINKQYLRRARKREQLMQIELKNYKQWQEADHKEQELKSDMVKHSKLKLIPQDLVQVRNIQLHLQTLSFNQLAYFKTLYWTVINITMSYIDSSSVFENHQYHLGVLNCVTYDATSLTILQMMNQQPYFENIFPMQFVSTLVTPQCGIAEYLHRIHLELGGTYSKLQSSDKQKVLKDLIGYAYSDHILLLSQVIMDIAAVILKLTNERFQDDCLIKGAELPGRISENMSTYSKYIMNQLFNQFQGNQPSIMMAVEDAVYLFAFLFFNPRLRYNPDDYFQDTVLKLILSGRAKQFFLKQLSNNF